MADVVLQYLLTSSGRWFVQLQGSYRWADDVNVEAGGANADIDLSDFSGSASVGFNF